MKSETLLAYTAAALLPLVEAKCTDFNFDTEYGKDGYTSTYNGTFPISNIVNCTSALAASDGGSNNQTCMVHHYAEGLVMHPEVRQITADEDSAAHIYSVVRKGAGTAGAATNFNTTVVANYTATQEGVPIDQNGFLGFTPFLRCWDGTLSGCKDEGGDGNAQFEGKGVTVCGLAWRDDQQAVLEPGRQLYSGDETVVLTDTVGGRQEPQPRYEDVASNQTISKDESSGAVRNLRVGLWLPAVLALAVGAILH